MIATIRNKEDRVATLHRMRAERLAVRGDPIPRRTDASAGGQVDSNRSLTEGSIRCLNRYHLTLETLIQMPITFTSSATESADFWSMPRSSEESFSSMTFTMPRDPSTTGTPTNRSRMPYSPCR